MPGGFDLKNKTLEQLKEQADRNYARQTTDFDKFWYLLNLTALQKQVNEAQSKLFEPDASYLDEQYDDPEEERKALEQYKLRRMDAFFTDEEKNRLTLPGDDNTTSKADQLNDYLQEKLDEDVFDPVTLSDMKKCYEMHGMMMAKIALEEAKEYEEKLKLIPENDPYRKEKAEYLQMMDTQSRVMSLDNALKNYINHFNLRNNSLTKTMLADSPIPSIEAMKKLSMKEYFEKTKTPKAEQDKFFEDRKKQGSGIDENSSVYDSFRYDFLYSQDEIKKNNPNYQKKPATDGEVVMLAKKDYHLRIMSYHQRLGNEIVKKSLEQEDRERVDYGIKLYSWNEYRPPKAIRDWAKKEGQKLVLQNRVTQLNENYTHFGNVLGTEKNLDVTKNGALSGPYAKPDQNASAYERFYHAHLGPRALFDDEAEQKKHLSLVMAAKAAESSGVPFDVKKIRKFAEGIEKSPAFKNLKNQDVREGLYDMGSAWKTQEKLLIETYHVPRKNQAEYIRKMKELSLSMIPPKGQSEKYQELHRAVSAIGAIDPNDPRLSNALMIANEKMLNAVVDYQKGKKSMRSSLTDSQKRFDNSMDALSVMNEYVPGFKPYAKELVDKTNLVRKVHIGDRNFVDLAAYGTERAKAAAPKVVSVNAPLRDLKAPDVGHPGL